MYYKKISFIIFTLFLSACRPLFQPPPYVSEQWKKIDTTMIETETVMLKCGYPSFAGEGLRVEPNKVALMHLCMEKHGFKYTGNLGRYCDRHPTVPACVEAAAAKSGADQK